MMEISFGDNVRVLPTPETQSLGLAGLVGQVYGQTTPSVTGVSVVGQCAQDYAINVQFEGRSDSIWFASQLLEFVDHSPGSEAVIGNKRFVRAASGEWIETPSSGTSPRAPKPWWRIWR
jgi:hypothetical protein